MKEMERLYRILLGIVLFVGIIALFGAAHAEQGAITVTEEEITLSVEEVEGILEEYEEYDPEFIKDIQSALNNHGANLKVDGDFGVKTGMAVKEFQRKKKLTIDGIVGPRTLKALGLEDNGVYPRYAPDIMKIYRKGSNHRMVVLTLGSNLVYAFEKRDDGMHLVRIMLAATGNNEKGNYTNLYAGVLKETPRKGAAIYGDKWEGDFAVPITAGDFFHSVLLRLVGGKWRYDDNSCLGKRVTHGCVRLSLEDAEWNQNFCTEGTAIIVCDLNWDLRP